MSDKQMTQHILPLAALFAVIGMAFGNPWGLVVFLVVVVFLYITEV